LKKHAAWRFFWIFARLLEGHEVRTAQAQGWARENGTQQTRGRKYEK